MENLFFHDTKEYKPGSIPAPVVDACSGQGDCTQSVEFWVNELGFDFPAAWAADYLNEYGAWDEKELEDHEANRRRVLWLACGDISEQGEFFGMLH